MTSERENSRTQASQLMGVVEVEQPEKTRLVLGPGLAGTLMTPDEFHDADEVDEDFRYELIQKASRGQALFPVHGRPYAC